MGNLDLPMVDRSGPLLMEVDGNPLLPVDDGHGEHPLPMEDGHGDLALPMDDGSKDKEAAEACFL